MSSNSSVSACAMLLSTATEPFFVGLQLRQVGARNLGRVGKLLLGEPAMLAEHANRVLAPVCKARIFVLF